MLLNEFYKMNEEVKTNKPSPEFKKQLKKKYKKLYDCSEKLFDKIYNNIQDEKELNIIKTMLVMKSRKENGYIDKMGADKKIGEILCDTYVKPMIDKMDKHKKIKKII